MMQNITTFQPTKIKILTLIANSVLAASTKAQYARVVEAYLDSGHSLTDPDALTAYASTLSKSRKAFLKAALKLYLKGIEQEMKAIADPTADLREVFETNQRIQSSLYRIDALNNAIQLETSKGEKAHTWLTQAEVKQLLTTCDTGTMKGKRDRIALGLLVGAGLRREELTGLSFDDVVRQPVAGRERVVLNVRGKGAKDRVVPLSDALAAALGEWDETVGGGNVARSVTKGGKLGDSISAVGIFHIVAGAGAAIGKLGLAPHDLRRSYAQIGLEAGVPLPQISKLLGHASIATTQRYLNLDLDLETSISDFVPFV